MFIQHKRGSWLTGGRHSKSSNSRNTEAHRRKSDKFAIARWHGLEPLDQRLLLAGDLFITLLHDVNGNGASASRDCVALREFDSDLGLNGVFRRLVARLEPCQRSL